MLVFPILLAIVGAVYLFAKCTYLRPKYTEDSLKTQVLTLISLVSFALYTGVSIRIFRLFKCKTFQNVRYLTEDYTTLCQGEQYTTYAAVGVLTFENCFQNPYALTVEPGITNPAVTTALGSPLTLTTAGVASDFMITGSFVFVCMCTCLFV